MFSREEATDIDNDKGPKREEREVVYLSMTCMIQVENSHIILTGATALNKVTTLKGWPGSAHVGAGAGSF